MGEGEFFCQTSFSYLNTFPLWGTFCKKGSVSTSDKRVSLQSPLQALSLSLSVGLLFSGMMKRCFPCGRYQLCSWGAFGTADCASRWICVDSCDIHTCCWYRILRSQFRVCACKFLQSTASCLRFCAVCEDGLQKEGADLCKSSFSSERGLHMALNTTDFDNSFVSLITSAGSMGGAAPFL